MSVSAGNGYRRVASPAGGRAAGRPRLLRALICSPMILGAGLLAFAGLALACLATVFTEVAGWLVNVFDRATRRDKSPLPVHDDCFDIVGAAPSPGNSRGLTDEQVAVVRALFAERLQQQRRGLLR